MATSVDDFRDENATPAVEVQNVGFRYGNRVALADVSFSVERGQIFGLLGPNGGGKTTLFRLLATLLPLQEGGVRLQGMDLTTMAADVRRRIGVTFQSPSIDGKLTVEENLRHQSHLYGLFGRASSNRIDSLSDQLGLRDRLSELAGSLSGGLKRRVEVAKSLLHHPELLLLDEPSTGLDPGARRDLWMHLHRLRSESSVTILVTTHLMEEAERCDRLGILDRGRLVALGEPDELRRSLGGECLTIETDNPSELSRRISAVFSVNVRQIGDSLRIEREAGHELLRDLVASFPSEIRSVSLAKPTLEDVFIARTGHRFWDVATEAKT